MPAADADDLSLPGLVRLDGGTGGGLAPRGRRLSLTVRHVLRSRTPEQAALENPALAKPLPLWASRQTLARWLDESPASTPVEGLK